MAAKSVANAGFGTVAKVDEGFLMDKVSLIITFFPCCGHLEVNSFGGCLFGLVCLQGSISLVTLRMLPITPGTAPRCL